MRAPISSRRSFLVGSAAAGSAGLFPSSVLAECGVDPLSGRALYRDVETFTALGVHRTASTGDNATTDWLKWKFENFGYQVDTPKFSFDLVEPKQCRVSSGTAVFEGFPAWPVVTTPNEGVTAPLANADSSALVGKIAVMSPAYRPGSSLTIPGFGDEVMRCVARGAIGVVLVTEGPTGGIIALNAHPEKFHWNVPVILVAGRDGDALRRLAARGDQATVILSAATTPNAQAGNVIARRRGQGKTVVISTPKSGWFTCAGERGSGIAMFLALAQTLALNTTRDLMFVATTGHEIEGAGGEHFLRDHAPKPAEVALWLHIGANIASNVVRVQSDRVVREATVHAQRGVLTSPELLSRARQAFAGQPGYSQPIDSSSDRAVGEVLIYRREGYSPLIGIVGGHPLHHTRLDIPSNVTSPEALEPVARGLDALMRAALAR